MAIHLRRGNSTDAAAVGEICYHAFTALAEAHNFLPDFPSPEAAAGMLSGLISHPGVFDIVAEIDGKVVGSNFLDERNPISGLGPITVDPGAQNDGAGRALMDAAMRDRGGELADAVTQGTALVVERPGRITGYSTSVGFVGQTVGESNDDIKALIGAAESFIGPGFLVPTRNGELLRWCLGEKLRITQTMTLMTIGLYNQPDGGWLPSVIY
ncbi:MAG TPA: GNAT family N-acetyltransferase [Steroidobacteraceae bacterium]|nr:GNAT family N-acetyltransferase [Steroidobacteraceae bacterium]